MTAPTKMAACVLLVHDYRLGGGRVDVDSMVVVAIYDAVKNPDGYGMSGGKVEPGESPVDAAARECREETGITVLPRELAFLYRGPCNGFDTFTFTTRETLERRWRRRNTGPRIGRNGPEGIVVLRSARDLMTGLYGRYNVEVVDAFCGLALTWPPR